MFIAVVYTSFAYLHCCLFRNSWALIQLIFLEFRGGRLTYELE